MKKAGIILLILFAFSSGIYSQKLIGIKIGPSIGLTAPASDYSGETTDFYNGTKYGMKSGVGFGAVGKVTLGPLNGRISVNYSSLSNDGVANTLQNNSTVSIKNSILMFTLGTEFGFGIPFSPVKPYAGIDLLFSTISGSRNFQGTSEVSSGSKDIKSTSRTGLGFAVGAEVGFGKTFIMDLSLRYNLHNLFGKEYEGVTNSNDRNLAYDFLNDAADPNFTAGNSKHPIGNSRSISTIQLQLGILFGF